MTEEEFKKLASNLERVGHYVPSVSDFIEELATYPVLVHNPDNSIVWKGTCSYKIPININYVGNKLIIDGKPKSLKFFETFPISRFEAAMGELATHLLNDSPEAKKYTEILLSKSIRVECSKGDLSYRQTLEGDGTWNTEVRFILTDEEIVRSAKEKILLMQKIGIPIII
jgi:hypothetical protein